MKKQTYSDLVEVLRTTGIDTESFEGLYIPYPRTESFFKSFITILKPNLEFRDTKLFSEELKDVKMWQRMIFERQKERRKRFNVHLNLFGSDNLSEMIR